MRASRLLFPMAFFLALPALGQPPKGIAEVTSDRLEIAHQEKSARFFGNVRAVYGDLTVQCDKMALWYDDKGEVTSLFAEGKVVVTRGAARATATSARLNAAEGLLVLEGGPTLQTGSHSLAGAAIKVYLKTSRIDVVEARGRFRFSAGEGKK